MPVLAASDWLHALRIFKNQLSRAPFTKVIYDFAVVRGYMRVCVTCIGLSGAWSLEKTNQTEK